MNDEYLGDGVYASLDEAAQIWLAVGDHHNKVVALEPEVMRALVRYAQRVLPKHLAEAILK